MPTADAIQTAQTAAATPPPAADPAAPPPAVVEAPKVTMTQAEIDALVASRLERDRAAQKGVQTKRAKELGYESLEAMEAAAQAHAAQVEASKTESQKNLEAKTRLEAELAQERALRAGLEDKIARARDYQAAGVDPGQLELLDLALDAAIKADPKLDRAAWLADQKAKRPFLFAGTAPPPQTVQTGANTGAPTKAPAAAPSGSAQAFNAMDPKLSRDQLEAEAQSLGINPKFLR